MDRYEVLRQIPGQVASYAWFRGASTLIPGDQLVAYARTAKGDLTDRIDVAIFAGLAIRVEVMCEQIETNENLHGLRSDRAGRAQLGMAIGTLVDQLVEYQVKLVERLEKVEIGGIR